MATAINQAQIQEELNRIQQALNVPKNNTNSFGGYKYRSCEDILEALKPLLGECTLTISDEVVNIGERYYVKATVTLNYHQQSVSTSAFARESQDKKGMDEAQITGSASSYARKYALNGLFAIDDTKDADATNDGSTVSPVKPQQTKPPIEQGNPNDTEKVANNDLICAYPDCGLRVSQKIADFSRSKFGEIRCFTHQKEQ